jgi:hypothetical protein
MDFVHYDLGQLRPGQVVQITLSLAAHVRLLDPANFDKYRTGQAYQFFGAYMTRSPAQVRVPSAGHWHLAVDLGGAQGTLTSSVTILGG